MAIQIATSAELEGWIDLRARLWDDTSRERHRLEATDILKSAPTEAVAILNVADDGDVRAFAEAALRHDYVNGCDTSPVAFLEGIFVHSADRATGVGRALLQAVQNWAQDRGCSELASDAHLDNLDSHAFHAALGFAETDRVVTFRKRL